MLPIVDLIASIGGLIIPPAFDFIKKKFVKGEADTPERTIGSLAMTKPEVLPDYTQALSVLKDSETKFFNRDVIGEASRWVVDLRAAIRPLGVVCSFVMLALLAILSITNHIPDAADPETITGVRISCEAMISSWFGHRISIK